MEKIETGFEGLFVLKPRIFQDSRGYFFESYNKNSFEKIGINENFIQDNQSMSQKNTLRGLHFQAPPNAQGKLIRVIKGGVLDVVVDIRKNSKMYGQHFAIELTETNFLMLYIPQGFAHGFKSLEDNTIFSYKCTDVYHPETEGGLLWNDRELNINWDVDSPNVSEKDTKYQPFSLFISPF